MGRINESVYGSENTWLNAPLSSANNGSWEWGKVANFGDNDSTLGKGVTTNKILINRHIDNTLSWCALGTESNYNKISVFDKANSWAKTIVSEDIMNFFAYQRYRLTTWGTGHPFCERNNADQVLWSPISALSSNMHSYISPFTDLSINKIVWCIYVRAHDDTTFSTSAGRVVDTTYSDYVTNHKTTHTVITRIYAKPYVWRTSANERQDYDSVSSVTSNTIFTFGLFTEYPFSVGGGHAIDYCLFDIQNSATTSITLFGRTNTASQNLGNAAYIYAVGIGDCKCNNNTSAFRVYQDENIDTVLENAVKTIACFGFYFVFDTAYVNDLLDSENVYMGVIPENFITHGVYTHGSANRNNPNWEWTGTSQSNYDPDNVDKTVYNKTTGFNAPTVAHSFTKRYVLNAAAVQNLAGELWAAVNTQGAGVDTAEFNNKLFLTNNPIDCIISLQKFPLSDIGGGEAEFIKLGAYTSTVVRGKPHTNTLRVIQFSFDPSGTNGFKSKYGGSFLDREPYTSAVLYVPYCGTVTLDPADYMDKTITVTMIIDYITGACTAYIAADNLVMTSLQGSCAIDLPVTGVQEMDLKAQIFNANQQLKAAKNQRQKTVTGDVVKNIVDPTGAGSAIAGMVMGSKGGAAGAAIGGAVAVSSTMPERATSANTLYSSNLSVQNAKYNISHMEVPFKEVGGSSPCTSAALESCCRIIITRPLTKYDPDIYGHTVGYLCNLTGTIKNFHGYAEITAVDLSGVPCTAEEKAIIKQSLAKGVYLP